MVYFGPVCHRRFSLAVISNAFNWLVCYLLKQSEGKIQVELNNGKVVLSLTPQKNGLHGNASLSAFDIRDTSGTLKPSNFKYTVNTCTDIGFPTKSCMEYI